MRAAWCRRAFASCARCSTGSRIRRPVGCCRRAFTAQFRPTASSRRVPLRRSSATRLAPWLDDALNAASQAHYGAPCGYIGQGGTIPLMSMLQQGFPAAQMMVCGVLGPKSNAHGPNEFLHVPYGKKLTAAVAQVMAAMAGAQAGIHWDRGHCSWDRSEEHTSELQSRQYLGFRLLL